MWYFIDFFLGFFVVAVTCILGVIAIIVQKVCSSGHFIGVSGICFKLLNIPKGFLEGAG